jgi:DNA-binding NtrC family response regulator
MNSPLTGRLMLIAEGEPLSALRMTLAFEDEGALVIRARTVNEALTAIEDHNLSAGILNPALSDGDTSAVCKRMAERNIPFVTCGGYEQSNEAARGGIHVKMPVGMPELVAIVRHAIAERAATGLDQAAGVIRSPAPNTPRRTLHLP